MGKFGFYQLYKFGDGKRVPVESRLLALFMTPSRRLAKPSKMPVESPNVYENPSSKTGYHDIDRMPEKWDDAIHVISRWAMH